MDDAYRVMGYAQFWPENLRGKDHFRDLGIE
jgi:hypothetical protein